MGKSYDHDERPGFTERPQFSEVGLGVGGVACVLGQLALLWVLGLSAEPSNQDNQIGFLFVMSVPVAVVAFLIGSFAGNLAQPAKSSAVGAVLSSLPVCCCLFGSGVPIKSISDVVIALLPWIGMIVAGGLSGWIGGVAGKRHLDRKLQPLLPAIAAREKAERRQAEQEAAEVQTAKEAEALDRCLSCGHVMESHVTCPKCGWTYL